MLYWTLELYGEGWANMKDKNGCRIDYLTECCQVMLMSNICDCGCGDYEYRCSKCGCLVD